MSVSKVDRPKWPKALYRSRTRGSDSKKALSTVEDAAKLFESDEGVNWDFKTRSAGKSSLVDT